MNYQKVDTALAIALDESQGDPTAFFEVFIHLDQPADGTMAAFLRENGAVGAAAEQLVVTARLTARQVDILTEQTWVRFLRMARQQRTVA